jgi:hypothetical protein
MERTLLKRKSAELGLTLQASQVYEQAQSAEEIRQMNLRLKELLGEQKAGYGASGVKSEGSPTDVMLTTTREGQRQIAYKNAMDQFRMAEERRQVGVQQFEMIKASKLASMAGSVGAWAGAVQTVGTILSSAYNALQPAEGFKLKSPITGRISQQSAGSSFNTWNFFSHL